MASDDHEHSAVSHRDLQNPLYVEWRQFLRASDGWDSDQIEEYQTNELRRIVQRAIRETPGYARLYAEHGVDGEIRSLGDLRRLPFMTKEYLRERLPDFTALAPGSEYITTGGSTGIPFGFYRDAEAFARELASKAHQYSRVGWSEGDKQMVLRGLVVNGQDRIEVVEDMCELRCSSYFLTDEYMERYRIRALSYRPLWLKCYPSSGYMFAKFLERTGREFPPIKGVLAASENLYDYQRDVLNRIFKARTFSHYGQYEQTALAGFCEGSDTYHVLPQYGYAELLRGELPVTQPGEAGEIVATSFTMRATPFIRYRTGDWAVLQGWGCPSCARPYQVWSRIEGREQELAVTAGGRYISMTAINMHDGIFDHVLQFQFRQSRIGDITFKYVPKPTCTPEIVDQMRFRLSIKFGDDMRISMEAVESIQPTRRGKHTFLVQELPVAILGERP